MPDMSPKFWSWKFTASKPYEAGEMVYRFRINAECATEALDEAYQHLSSLSPTFEAMDIVSMSRDVRVMP